MPEWITPEFLEEVSSPALELASRTTTSRPFLDTSLAIARPITPAPTITVSVFKTIYPKKRFFLCCCHYKYLEKNKKILICVTGSIAAFKACEVIRLLRKQEAKVQVMMSASAEKFIGKATFAYRV